MTSAQVSQLFLLLEQSTTGMTPPMTELIQKDFGRNPYLVLTACLLSLRAQDTITYARCQELFSRAKNPSQMLTLSVEEIEKIIYPINYYKKKARQIHIVSSYLLTEYGGQVPQTKKALLSIPGVGLKTANLVLAQAFDQDEICVDIHVHRLSNRLGLVQTKTAEQTEQALKETVPQHYWRLINHYFVIWGQNICRPISPKCSLCPLSKESICPRIGVIKSR